MTDNDGKDAKQHTDAIVGAALRKCFADGTKAYVVRRGAGRSGFIMIIQNITGCGYRILMQTVGETGESGWLSMPGNGLTPDYTDIHPIVERAKSRDPDLWVIEIQTKDEKIPFDGKIFE